MQRFRFYMASLFVVLGILIGASVQVEATCTTNVSWEGEKLQKGQIGKVSVLKDTPIVTFKNKKTVVIGKAKRGNVYKVYAIQTNYFHIGNHRYIKNSTNVRYKAVPKEKLVLLACEQKTTSATISMNGLTIGDTRAKVEALYGKAKRKSLNDYGLYWETYDKGNYREFMMISYENDKIVAMYTNHPIVKTKTGITLSSSKQQVQKTYGTPISFIDKGTTTYIIEDDEYSTYMLDGNYVTFFFDKHQNNQLSAVQVVRKDLEEKKNGFYGTLTDELRTAYEYQIFDLVNAVRLKNHVPLLSWDGKIANTARKHSEDMAKNQYFSHTNLKGLSPFDRMQADGISFSTAGENIAYGQFNAIYVHEAWMNSLGHRRNVLDPSFQRLGVGAAFDSFGRPYYTQNFYTP
ncbi:MAG: serine protease [Anoxybacillus sp.]|nr:CAP-associated domain-containing protein [Anoxybacillus sp.]MCL6586224.1 serine protease [Anoxybacillus sp.]